MKRNVFRRSLSLLLMLFVALGMTTTVFAREVQAGDVVFFVDPDKVYVGYEAYAGVYCETEYDVVTKSVTSSNTAVGKIVKRDGYYYVKGVAPGKTTVTCKYTYKGEEGSLSVPVTVKKVPKLFKSVKLNGKKVKLSKHPFGANKKAAKATSVKIKVSPSSAWKIKSVNAYVYKGVHDTNGKKIKVSTAKIKKGKKIAFAKKYKNMVVEVRLVNKKTGEKEYYTIQFYRKTPFVS